MERKYIKKEETRRFYLKSLPMDVFEKIQLESIEKNMTKSKLIYEILRKYFEDEKETKK